MTRVQLLLNALRTAWKSLKTQLWLLVGLYVGYLIISLLLTHFVTPSGDEPVTAAGIAVLLLNVVFSLLFTLGYTKNLFQTLDGEEPQFSAYGQQSGKIIPFLTATVLYALIVFAGLVLFVLPGIYLLLRLQFFTQSMVDENTGIIESLKRSWEITKKKELLLLLLLLLSLGLTLIGGLLFLIGLLVTGPLIGLINCRVFRELTAFDAKAEN